MLASIMPAGCVNSCFSFAFRQLLSVWSTQRPENFLLDPKVAYLYMTQRWADAVFQYLSVSLSRTESVLCSYQGRLCWVKHNWCCFLPRMPTRQTCERRSGSFSPTSMGRRRPSSAPCPALKRQRTTRSKAWSRSSPELSKSQRLWWDFWKCSG